MVEIPGITAFLPCGAFSAKDPAISISGRYLTFTADAPGGYRQVYVHNFRTGTTRLESVSPSGGPGSWDTFVRDLRTGVTTMVSNGSDGFSGEGGAPPKISADGMTVVFDSEAPDLVPVDTNDLRDVFVRDR